MCLCVSELKLYKVYIYIPYMCIQKTTRAQLLMLSKAFTGNDMYMSDACHLILSKERHIGQFQWWNSFLGA